MKYHVKIQSMEDEDTETHLDKDSDGAISLANYGMSKGWKVTITPKPFVKDSMVTPGLTA